MMKIEIDQSGRIEYTSKLSVVAYSNSANKSLLITAKDKRKIQAIYRRIGQPRLFAQKVFAVAIFALIKNKKTDIKLTAQDFFDLAFAK
ncbi:hypothetical protein A2V71_02640 [Candidatus Berkelbacteria bacterium RBG_13_40_8]|uniref:Uncharacterized protein n=1 Tax=Candidatus Berkelbacteria bacterium RBG_13_40_8 TaxID=1797467 RepID=A0A1F5DPB0_9BACT|nr:MAG: hypothetical protein A2V71_02640 [Candidatus Berkelbacteria bacterium RBG_13_40_8]